MSDKLSILDDEQVSLRTNASDVKAALLKGVVGAAPIVGPIVSEALSIIIPNQKINRVITFVEILDIKVRHLGEDLLKQKLLTEEFTDLFEDAASQASRAISDDRIEYIASLLKNGLSSDDLTHLGNKKLLELLGELNDAEILILKFHTLMGNRQREFAEQHGKVFAVQPATLGAGRDVIDRQTIRDTYTQNLTRLRLLVPRYQRVRKGEVPEFDDRTGMVKSTGHEATSLGRLLLRRLDIAESDW